MIEDEYIHGSLFDFQSQPKLLLNRTEQVWRTRRVRCVATPPSFQRRIARPSEVEVECSGQSSPVNYGEVFTIGLGQWNDRLKEVRQLVDRHISAGYVQPDQREAEWRSTVICLALLILLPFFVTVSAYTTVTLAS